MATLTLSASSLTVFDHCPRLFQYVFIDRLLWPAAMEGTSEETQRGKRFHRLVELHSRGESVDLWLEGQDPILQTYWQQFLASPHAQPDPAARVLAEVPLWTMLQGVRLTARLDRLVISGQQLTICDWKTERQRPTNGQLARNWQVRLYPLMVMLLAKALDVDPIQPDDLSVVFWYANHPTQPYQMTYSPEQFQRDLTQLQQTLHQLHSQPDYPMTRNLQTCSRCIFRTRCYGLVPDQIDPSLVGLFEWFSPSDPEMEG